MLALIKIVDNKNKLLTIKLKNKTHYFTIKPNK